MPYYPTLAEDVARAKEILAKGQPSTWEKAQFTPEVVEALRQVGGGTIYGADVYAAYKLLESFVAELAARERIIETYEAQLAKRDEELFTLRAVAKELEQETARQRELIEAVGPKVAELALRVQQRAESGERLCRTTGCGHGPVMHIGGICQACPCDGWR